MKKIYILLKRIVLSFLTLYGFNVMAAPINVIIPINIITVSLIVIFGTPGVIFLILLLILVF